MSSFSDVLAAAHGRWPEIASVFTGDALKEAAMNGGRAHVACPVHGSDGAKKPFRVFKDFEHTGGAVCSQCGTFANGIDTIAWLLGENPVQTRNKIADYLGLDEAFVSSTTSKPVQKPVQVLHMPKQEEDDGASQRELKKAQKLWDEALPITATHIAVNYFLSRGMKLEFGIDFNHLDTVLRVHPGVDYWEADEEGNFHKIGTSPCLLSRVFSKGVCVNIHRTFLHQDGHGKANFSMPKKLMTFWGDSQGSYIPMAPFAAHIGVAEGIETALSVQTATGIPTMATVSAPLMKSFEPHPDVKNVSIFADLDRSEAGLEAATALQQKLQSNGVKARILLPMNSLGEEKSIDFLDVYNEFGPEAIRYQASVGA